MNILIFGFGYVAKHWVKSLKDSHHIHVTARDTNKIDWDDSSITTHLFGDDLSAIVYRASAILVTAPPDGDGCPAFLKYGQLISQANKLQWLGYLSTTGVYGNHDGNWVDESAPPAPTGQNAKNRVLAEQQWLKLYEDYQTPVHVFRLSGIYGPGRNMIDRLNQGMARRINKPGHVMNRIHVADICQVLNASMHSATPGEIYNLADDLPASTSEVIDYVCQQHNIAMPKLEQYDPETLPPMAVQFYQDNKRVSNRKIKQQLGVDLKFPTYKEYYKTR